MICVTTEIAFLCNVYMYIYILLIRLQSTIISRYFTYPPVTLVLYTNREQYCHVNKTNNISNCKLFIPLMIVESQDI